MKFTVEIEEDWIEDGEIQQELKRQIIQSVVDKILPSLIDGHVRLVGELAKDVVISHFDAIAKEELTKFILEGKVKSDRSNSQISIPDFIKERFEYNGNYNSQKELIEKMAKQHSNELKSRYDMLFASQIVIKMSEQGLLKDGVLQSLMGRNEDEFKK